jgi:hypothetical protein
VNGKEMNDKERLLSLQLAVGHLAGALVSTRAVLAMVANQPTLLLNQTVRLEVTKKFEEGNERLDKAFDMIEKLAGTSNE